MKRRLVSVTERAVGMSASVPLGIIAALDEVSEKLAGGRSAVVVAALALFLSSYRDGERGPYSIEDLVPPGHPAYRLLAALEVKEQRKEGK